MKAQTISHFGPPSVFTAANVAKPTVKSGHILIKVHATSVNPIDCKIRSGATPHLAPSFPAILHGDVAGTVIEVSEDISDFQEGDEIYGLAGGIVGINGALAEYMIVKPEFIAKKPATLSMFEAAALPLISITSWLALFNKLQITPDSKILIQGGAGGVGHLAIQLAKITKAKIFTTVSNKRDGNIVTQLGANEVIYYREEEVAAYVSRLTHNLGFDFIFDTVGGNNLVNSFQAAAHNGSIVTTASRVALDLTPLHEKGLSLHVVYTLLSLLENTPTISFNLILQKIAKLVDAGKIKPLIDHHHFTLETVREAHTYFESGKAEGKVIIRII